MVYKIILNKIEDDIVLKEYYSILNDVIDYSENKGINIRENIFGYEDEKFEYLFVFCNIMDFNFLKNLIIENNIEILESLDFTENLIKIIKDNQLNDFKQKLHDFSFIDEKINNFILSNISKDDILDKILDKGIESLSEIELEILQK